MFYHARGDYEQAKVYWGNCLELARKTGQHQLLLFLFNYLAAIAINYSNDYQRAEHLFLEGLDWQRKHQNLSAMSLQLMNLSMIAFDLGNYEQANTYLQESKKIAQEIGYPLVLIILSRYKAALLVAQHRDYEKAKQGLQAGEQLARNLRDAAATGFILVGLGKMNARLNNFAEAVTNLQEALLFSIETRRQDMEIEALACLGFIAGERGQPQLAESHFEKALLLAHSYHDTWYLSQVLADWGEFCLTQEQWAQAGEAFEELLAISRQSGFLALTAVAHFGLSRVALAQGDSAKAKLSGKESQTIFAQIGHHKSKRVQTWVENIPFAHGHLP